MTQLKVATIYHGEPIDSTVAVQLISGPDIILGSI